jgi:cytochrome c-type protein NapB
MKNRILLLGIQLLSATVILTAAMCSYAAQPISADNMGLSKTSVFNTPNPEVYQYPLTEPGLSKLLPRAYLGAPPQVPHDVSNFMPITVESNMCMACHHQPELRGKARASGGVVPIPVSHYLDHRQTSKIVNENIIKARYNCNQCHVPQSNAPALVQNTFKGGITR